MKIITINLRKTSRLWVYAVISFIVIVATIVGVIIDSINFDIGAVSAEPAIRRTVILDAGHGGEDSGAVGQNGILEKDLNLEIAMMLGNLLAEQGIKVVYTRIDDRMLYLPEENIKGMRKISDLRSRVKVSSENPGAIFVSIHMNSFGDSRYSGLQVYARNKDNASLALAESIRQEVVNRVETDNKRAVKSGESIYVLERNENTAVLIECGFLSNEAECERLSQKEFQKELSFSIVCGIIKYMEEN